MATPSQMLALGEACGFSASERRGFVGLARVREDGYYQRLDFFRWSNRKHAAAAGVPRAYLVVCISLNGRAETGRWIVPLVEWPSELQEPRPWVDVAEEFKTVFPPILDAPLHDARARLVGLERRYRLT